MKKTYMVAATAVIALALAAPALCAPPEPATPATPAAEPASKPDAAKQVKPRPSGKVVETLDAAGYTYVCLEKDGKKSWVAVPAMKVSVGEELEFPRGVEMGTYTSKTLNRTFDNIIFTARPQPKEPAAAPATPAAGHGGDKSGAGHDSGTSAISGKVVETMDSGGYSYLFIDKEGTKRWVAVPAMKIAVGDAVTLQNGKEMTNFTSKGLKRTFESIIFSEGPVAGN